MTITTRRSKADDALGQVRRALGHRRPPLRTIWQKAFDYDERHLHRLVALGPQDEPDSGDLVDYCMDVQYEEIQPDLFRHVLPFCLCAWREDLFGHTLKYGAFVEHFYPALVRSRALDRLLFAPEREAVTSFIQRSILLEIEAQHSLAFRGSRASPYRWIRALTTSGVLLPDIAVMWREWWTIRNLGQAYAALQYVSCLVYGEDDNPVFAPWTRLEGGGPPTLWEFEGHLYDDCWQPSNVAFLTEILTVDSLRAVVGRSIAQLTGLPDFPVARKIEIAFAERTDVVRQRCEELCRFLAVKQGSTTDFNWSR